MRQKHVQDFPLNGRLFQRPTLHLVDTLAATKVNFYFLSLIGISKVQPGLRADAHLTTLLTQLFSLLSLRPGRTISVRGAFHLQDLSKYKYKKTSHLKTRVPLMQSQRSSFKGKLVF